MMKIYMTNIDDYISLPGIQKNMVFFLAGGKPQAAVLRSAVQAAPPLSSVFPSGTRWNDAGFPDVGYEDIATVIFFLLNTWQLFGYLDGKIMSRHCKLLDWTWLPSGKHVQKTMENHYIFHG